MNNSIHPPHTAAVHHAPSYPTTQPTQTSIDNYTCTVPGTTLFIHSTTELLQTAIDIAHHPMGLSYVRLYIGASQTIPKPTVTKWRKNNHTAHRSQRSGKSGRQCILCCCTDVRQLSTICDSFGLLSPFLPFVLPFWDSQG